MMRSVGRLLLGVLSVKPPEEGGQMGLTGLRSPAMGERWKIKSEKCASSSLTHSMRQSPSQ
eukprot:9400359-Pyramimonas_sp.AAC.1